MKYQIIIARYNEALDWTHKLNKQNIVVYNKGSNIDIECICKENVGREGETFLYHIVNNYDNLPDYLILLQGDPFDHMHNINPDNLQNQIDDLVNSNIDDIQQLFCNKHYENHYLFPSLKTREYYSFLFSGRIPDQTIFAAGGQYIIPKKNILSRPLQFYKKIHSMIQNTKIHLMYQACHGDYLFCQDFIDGWCLERLFMFLFLEDIPISKK